MHRDDTLYRRLQRHLDRQAIGFPATRSGADIRLLRRLFTPDEARLALFLSDVPAVTSSIVEAARGSFTEEQTVRLLDSMIAKGSIGWRKKDGADHWFVMPLVIGMYEQQDGDPSPAFLEDARSYLKTWSFGRSFLSVRPSQMRTIPIAGSVPVEHPVATYDQVRAMVADIPGPFVVLPCICRASKATRDLPCARTSRKETCLAFGDMAAGVLRRGHGREISRGDVLAILRQNEQDGLVLQPANTRRPEFICSCCGCCCGMLSFLKLLPRPVDFWTSSYHAEVEAAACSQCGTCASRCQVGAVALTGPARAARVDRDRCIGCGLCVTSCPAGAVRLVPRDRPNIPPRDERELLEQVRENRRGPLGQWATVFKAAFMMKQ